MARLEEYSDYYYSNDCILQINPYIDHAQIRFECPDSTVTCVNPLDIHLPMKQEPFDDWFAMDSPLLAYSDPLKLDMDEPKRKRTISSDSLKVVKKRLTLKCKCPEPCSACNRK
jgi:hypothetical protein